MSKGDGKSSEVSAMLERKRKRKTKMKMKMKMKVKMKMKTKTKKGPLFIVPIRPFSTSILMSALYIIKQEQKREKKKMMKLGDDIHDELKEMEVLAADIRSEQEYKRRSLQEGKERVKALQALLAQNRDTNNQLVAMNLRDELLAHHIYFNIIILPYP